jgi:hypothetical protein
MQGWLCQSHSRQCTSCGKQSWYCQEYAQAQGDVITAFRTQGTSKVTIPPRTISETGQKNGITLELAYCDHDYAIITLLDSGIPAYRVNGPYNEGPDDPSEGLPPSDDSL